MFEFYNIFILCLISATLSIVIVGLSYFIVKQQADPEKVSAYECGFEPFDDARNTFDIRFYLVAILFIVFDLEISFLFPWVLVLQNIGYLGIYAMFIFLFILTVGFVYEWCKGALDWN